MKKFKLMFNNLRGVKSKLTSIKEIMKYESPAIAGLAETKLEGGEIIKLEGYWKSGQGGGRRREEEEY